MKLLQSQFTCLSLQLNSGLQAFVLMESNFPCDLDFLKNGSEESSRYFQFI